MPHNNQPSVGAITPILQLRKLLERLNHLPLVRQCKSSGVQIQIQAIQFQSYVLIHHITRPLRTYLEPPKESSLPPCH